MQEQFEATTGRPMQVAFRQCRITKTKQNKQTKTKQNKKAHTHTHTPTHPPPPTHKTISLDSENRSPQFRAL